MITVTPAATLAIKDASISPNPNPVPFAGTTISCPVGALSQDVTLAAATVDAALPFPSGVTTAKILAIYAQTVPDLIVKVLNGADEVELEVPVNQPLFLYNVAAADVSISSVLGGKLTAVVGG